MSIGHHRAKAVTCRIVHTSKNLMIIVKDLHHFHQRNSVSLKPVFHYTVCLTELIVAKAICDAIEIIVKFDGKSLMVGAL